MAQQSFAKYVLDKALELSASTGEVSCEDLSSALFIQTRDGNKRMRTALYDLWKAGKLVRIRQRVYGPPRTDAPSVDKREVMWRVFRMRRRVIVDDLMEMAGVSKEYAREWLLVLVKHKAAKKIQEPGKPGVWLLITDSFDMPQDEDKAARLRGMRLKKKEVLARLNAIDTAVASMREILLTMGEE